MQNEQPLSTFQDAEVTEFDIDAYRECVRILSEDGTTRPWEPTPVQRMFWALFKERANRHLRTQEIVSS